MEQNSLSFSLESPTIIVQQRIDVAYDGGKPIWKKPAVVYASGPVASIGVIVTGIRKYTVSKLGKYLRMLRKMVLMDFTYDITNMSKVQGKEFAV